MDLTVTIKFTDLPETVKLGLKAMGMTEEDIKPVEISSDDYPDAFSSCMAVYTREHLMKKNGTSLKGMLQSLSEISEAAVTVQKHFKKQDDIAKNN